MAMQVFKRLLGRFLGYVVERIEEDEHKKSWNVKFIVEDGSLNCNVGHNLEGLIAGHAYR